MNYAGGWLVSDELEPDHRAAFLGLAYLAIMFTLTVFAYFPAFLILWLARVQPMFSGLLTVLFGFLMLPASFFAWTLISSFVQR